MDEVDHDPRLAIFGMAGIPVRGIVLTEEVRGTVLHRLHLLVRMLRLALGPVLVPIVAVAGLIGMEDGVHVECRMPMIAMGFVTEVALETGAGIKAAIVISMTGIDIGIATSGQTGIGTANGIETEIAIGIEPGIIVDVIEKGVASSIGGNVRNTTIVSVRQIPGEGLRVVRPFHPVQMLLASNFPTNLRPFIPPDRLWLPDQVRWILVRIRRLNAPRLLPDRRRLPRRRKFPPLALCQCRWSVLPRCICQSRLDHLVDGRQKTRLRNEKLLRCRRRRAAIL